MLRSFFVAALAVAFVAPAGKVESVSVVNAQPARVFERSAVAAVKKWSFAPGGGRGKVRLDFAL